MGRPYPLLAAITTFAITLTTVLVAKATAETHFASSSINSDPSGTRSSQYVGSSNGGGGGVISSRLGPGNGGGGGITVVSGGGGSSGGGAFSGTSSGNGETVGIFSRTGPGGTQHTVVGPSGTRVYNQPAGSYQGGGGYTYPYNPGYYNDYYGRYDYGNNYYPQPAVAVAGPNGAFAGAGAGGTGAFAGAGGGGSYSDYNY